MDDERLTEELRIDQEQREARERELARSTGEENEVAQHERRADKAEYLRKKLEEREASEKAVGSEDS
jgi:uncharacterized protein YdaU (DUF1376 family)